MLPEKFVRAALKLGPKQFLQTSGIPCGNNPSSAPLAESNSQGDPEFEHQLYIYLVNIWSSHVRKKIKNPTLINILYNR
jgi:hypothetical protein